MAVDSGGQSCPATHLNSVPPHFMSGTLNYHEAVKMLCAVVNSQQAIACCMRLTLYSFFK